MLLAAIAAPACGTLLSIDSSEPPVAAPAGDASSETGALGDASPDGGCGARFCCDFDQPTPCAWSGEEGSSSDVTFAIEPTQAVSPPNALHVATSGTVDEATRMMFLDIDGVPTKVSVAAHLRLDAVINGDSTSVHPIEITCDGKVAIALKMKKSGALVVGGGDAEDVVVVDPFPLGAFASVALDLERIGADLHAQVTTSAPGAIVTSYQEACSGPVRVNVGAAVAGGAGAYDLRLDDVRIDW